MIILLTLALSCSQPASGADELHVVHQASPVVSHNQHGPTASQNCQVRQASLSRIHDQHVPTASRHQAAPATSRNQAAHIQATTAISRNQSAAATSKSHHQAVVAMSRNQHASAFQSHTSTPSHFPATAGQHGTDGSRSDSETDGESEGGDNAILPQARAKQNSKKSYRELHPHHLGFYSGAWYDALVDAKNRYRFFIHTQKPFPDRNINSLRDAQECLIDAVENYLQNGIQLNEGTVNDQLLIYTIVTNNIVTAVYNAHRSSMTSLVRFNPDVLQYFDKSLDF